MKRSSRDPILERSLSDDVSLGAARGSQKMGYTLWNNKPRRERGRAHS